MWTTIIRTGIRDNAPMMELPIPITHALERGTCEVFGVCAIQYGSEILSEALERFLNDT